MRVLWHLILQAIHMRHLTQWKTGYSIKGHTSISTRNHNDYSKTETLQGYILPLCLWPKMFNKKEFIRELFKLMPTYHIKGNHCGKKCKKRPNQELMSLSKGAPCSTKHNSIGLKFTFYSTMVLRVLRPLYLWFMHVYIQTIGQFTPAYALCHICVTFLCNLLPRWTYYFRCIISR